MDMIRNRRQRRADKSGGSTPAASGVAALFAAAVESHQSGRLGDAETLYRRVLALEPRHAEALHRLGILAYQVGDVAVAIEVFDRALVVDERNSALHIHRGLALAAAGRLDEACAACGAGLSLDPRSVEGHANLGLILLQAGRFEAAEDAGRRTIALAPELADGHNILGGALQALGRAREAVPSHRRAVALAPDYAEAHTSLGNALSDVGDLDDAIAHHRRAIALQPDFAEAHNNLGQALLRIGRPAEATDHFRHATRADPAFVLAYSNLAGALKAQGDFDGATASLRQAAAVSPAHPVILNNLAITLQARGDIQGAMETVIHGLAAAETPHLRQTFVHCVKALRLDAGADTLRPLLTRALREGWGRPENLVRTALDVVKRGATLQAAIARATGPFSGGGDELIDNRAMVGLGQDELLLLLLASTPNIDFDVERALIAARRTLLDRAEAGAALSSEAVAFCAALAHQCFINEYVFGLELGEAGRAAKVRQRLSDAVMSGAPLPVEQLLAAACYAPLSDIADADILLEQAWPDAVASVLKAQIAEPALETNLRRDIPRLTPIGAASLEVQAQYEENPYPRWISTNASAAPEALAEHLRNAFPHADIAPFTGAEPDVLIAGCGTGRNALETHRALAGARTLAIDLSLTSLAYAQRKALEAGATNLEFAQADLLNIGVLARRFDVIEASGVLHHLADPFAGWRALLSALRPGGVMRLGFYSALARRDLPKIEVGEATTEALRQARQTLAARPDRAANRALLAQDFYSLSGCRDLLFHTQEHRFALGELAAFIRAENLSFIGLVVDDQVLAAYARQFPHDPGGRDLEAWAAFEEDHPDTFAKMYQFWVQKG